MDITGFEAIFQLFKINGSTTIALAGFVMALLAAVKKFLPQLQGNVSVIAAGVLSLLFSAKAYWFPTPDWFAIIMSAIFVFGFAVGGFELVKKAGGVTPPVK